MDKFVLPSALLGSMNQNKLKTKGNDADCSITSNDWGLKIEERFCQKKMKKAQLNFISEYVRSQLNW